MTLADYFMEHADVRQKWHPDRNALTPEQVMFGSRKRVWWRCGQGHEWEAPVYSVTGGGGCPYCAGKRAIPGVSDLATTHPQILRFWHEENTIRPQQVTAGSHRKVKWHCDKGHEWDAIVSSVVLDGCGCPYCAGKRAIPGETDLATLRPDLMEQWDFEKNTIDPRETTVAAHDKVWWKCELGHSYEAVVFSRTREKGSGCPYCTGRKVLAGFNDLATLKPKVAEEWYQTLNGHLRPENVSIGSNQKVWWHCRAGHVWRAAVYSRTRKRGAGCPVCAGTVKQEPTVSKTIRPAVRSGASVRLK